MCEIVTIECLQCSYHLGLDLTYLDHVGYTHTNCPACGNPITITEGEEEEDQMPVDNSINHVSNCTCGVTPVMAFLESLPRQYKLVCPNCANTTYPYLAQEVTIEKWNEFYGVKPTPSISSPHPPPLFNHNHRYTGYGITLTDAIHDVIHPILKQYAEAGYSLQELAGVVVRELADTVNHIVLTWKDSNGRHQ